MANNYYRTYEAVEYLINHGHRKLGFITSTQYSYNFRERFRGFTDCTDGYKDLGVTVTGITERHDDYYTPFSNAHFYKMLKYANRPTTLLCSNDLTTFLIYELLHEEEFKTPEDISAIGLDNVEKCEWVTLTLTSVNISKAQMGKRAVDLILKRIDDPERYIELLMIGTEIVKRKPVLSFKEDDRS